MDAERAKQLFKQADELYLNRRYQEALAILGQLNQAFPNQKNVLWPSALCMNKLGRYAEAIRICDALIQFFNDERAEDLKARTQAQMQMQSAAPPPMPQDILDGGVNLADLDAMIDRPPPPPRERPKAAPDYKNWLIMGAGVMAVVVLFALPFLGRGGASAGTSPSVVASGDATGTESADQAAPDAAAAPASHGTIQEDFQALGPEPTPEQMLAVIGSHLGIRDPTWAKIFFYFMLLIYLMTVVTYGPGMFVGLRVLEKLPSDEWQENVVDVLAYTFLFSALSFLCCPGWIVILVIMAKHYELSYGQTALCALITGVIATVLSYVITHVLPIGLQ